MKRNLLFILMLISGMSLFSQRCNTIIFNQDGEPFKVIVNGVLQNPNFETNVLIRDLNFEGSYKLTIDFKNPQLPSLNKNIYMMERSSQYTYNVKKNRKGVYVMRMMGVVPIHEAPAPLPTQSVIVYSTSPPMPVATTIVETTTTTTSNNGNQDQISLGLNLNGAGVNMNINVNDGGSNHGNSTTTTTTTYTETVGASGNEYANEQIEVEEHYIMPVYNGPIGCSWPMSDTDFRSAKQSIASKSFSDSRLTLAKQIINSNCITSGQAKQIIELFDFEETKLDFAKYAYGYTYDIGNFYKVNDAFTFESTIEELNNFIEGR